MSPRRWFGLVLLSGLLVVPSFALFGWTRSPAPFPRKKQKGFTNSIGMQLVGIPAGKFTMGPPREEAGQNGDQGSQHEVQITKPFYLGVHEVTQGQWKAVMGKDNNPSAFCKEGMLKDRVNGLSEAELDNFPVETVSWEDTQAFLKKLNALAAEKKHGVVYRLPTEAEWEYACRGGPRSSTKPFHFNSPSDSLGAGQANFNARGPYGDGKKGEESKRTNTVGKNGEPNALGLYDMHGNVWEWCSDWYEANYRVRRGGSFGHFGRYCRAAYRGWDPPARRSLHIGFRVAAAPLK